MHEGSERMVDARRPSDLNSGFLGSRSGGSLATDQTTEVIPFQHRKKKATLRNDNGLACASDRAHLNKERKNSTIISETNYAATPTVKATDSAFK